MLQDGVHVENSNYEEGTYDREMTVVIENLSFTDIYDDGIFVEGLIIDLTLKDSTFVGTTYAFNHHYYGYKNDAILVHPSPGSHIKLERVFVTQFYDGF